MNSGFRKSLTARSFAAACVSAALVIPVASQAQTNTMTGTKALASNTSGYNNTATGYEALFSNTTGNFNTASGASALYTNTTGSGNTADGFEALFFNTTGYDNTANGNLALAHNTTGYDNTASGFQVLASNTTGNNNVANGNSALYSNTTGSNNTAHGAGSLYTNTTGNYNSSNGYEALFSNTTGGANTATGVDALYANTTGDYNTANGADTLSHNTTASYNTAEGPYSLYANTTGGSNTAIGVEALYSNTTGSNNIALGFSAGMNITTGGYNIDIGHLGASTDSGVIRIGTRGAQNSVYIAGVNGVTASGGVELFINANSQLGTITSSRRFKKDIHDMGRFSDKLMQLRPVTFRYKKAADDGSHPLQYGLIAEEVAKVYPDLVQYDKQGKPFTIYYHLLTPMLLNALQKEHRQNVAMKVAHNAQIATLNVRMTALAVAYSEDKAEIASLKQSLAKLAAYVETSQNRAPLQKAVFVQH